MTLQQDLHTTTGPNLLEAPDFSLVLGGPLFQLFRRSHLEGDGIAQLDGGLDRLLKTGQVLRQDDTPLDEAAHNRAQSGMDNQLGGDENRKCNEESDMHFNVVKEGEPRCISSRGAKSRQEQQWQPGDQRNNEQPAIQKF